MYFAVIGKAVRERSASPAMHKASFKKLGIDAEYWAIDVPREELSCFIQIARLNLRGFNITIPHKEEIVKHLDVLSTEARAIGAVNTVSNINNVLMGYNTDASAVYNLAGRYIRGADVLIIGAGGAARAALFASIKAEASKVYIMNRTYEKAKALAQEFINKFRVEIAPVPWLNTTRAKVVINATPIHNQVLADLSEADVYIEFVYTPTPFTKMVEEANRRGVRVVDGVELLVEQGAEAERIWLGVEPDKSVMKEAVLKFLRL